MNCEICGLEVNAALTSCEHPKNGYCAIFADKKPVTLADLQPGDTFRYKNSDDWHIVIKIDENKIYYAGYLPDVPQSNYRVDNVIVILK